MKFIKRAFLAVLLALSIPALGADYYGASGDPATGSALSSSILRAEYSAIAAGFAKVAPYTSNASKAVIINSGGTAQTVTTGTLGLAGNFATTGAFNTTLIQGATTSLTLPLVSGTLATLAGTEELDNKTLDSSVGKGTWTASGTWTLPAITLGGTVSGGGQALNNIVIGGVTPLAGTFTTLVATSVNGNTITTGTGVLTLAAGKTLTASKTMQLTAADDTGVYTFPTGTKTLLAADGTGASLTAVDAITLLGNTWAAPESIGSGTPAAGAFTTLSASGSIAANAGLVIAASQALTGTVASSTISGFLSVAATTGTFTTLNSATGNFTGLLQASGTGWIRSSGTIQAASASSINLDFSAGGRIIAYGTGGADIANVTIYNAKSDGTGAVLHVFSSTGLATTLTTAAQPNITSLGTIAALVAGTVTASGAVTFTNAAQDIRIGTGTGTGFIANDAVGAYFKVFGNTHATTAGRVEISSNAATGIRLQSSGSDVAAFTSGATALTGTLAVTGAITGNAGSTLSSTTNGAQIFWAFTSKTAGGTVQTWTSGTNVSNTNADFEIYDNTLGGATPAFSITLGTKIITMPAYGAGTATFSAAGVISSVSDERLKIKDGVIKNAIPMLMALEPGYFYGKPEANMGEDRQLGFYAQNVRKAIGPEAAPDPLDGRPWGYFDRSVLAVTVNAAQDHERRLQALERRPQ